MATLLLVEDDPIQGELASQTLVNKGHRVDWVSSGEDAKEYLLTKEYEAVILDWQLPMMSGIEILRFIRQQSMPVAVLMLTSRSEIQHKEQSFEIGADDYLTKPYDARELSSRVLALLRRPREYSSRDLQLGNLRLNPEEHKVEYAGRRLELMPKEFALLELFMKHPSRVYSVNAILENVWNMDDDVTEMAVRVTVARLRKKLTEVGAPSVRTVHGSGYKLETDPEQSL
jgi:DNA-binding response OmpR family regulator